VLVWNYQGTDNETFNVIVDMENLPAALRGKTLVQRQYRIDHKISNYWANPATANLQQVSQSTLPPRHSHQVTVDLTPNALQLITLEPQ
jgi:hypothetical protein